MKPVYTLLVVLVTAGLIFGFYHFKPEAKRKKPTPLTPVVETMLLHKSSHDISLESFGTVIPEKELTIVSEVQGIVTEKNSELLPGGLLKSDEVITQIDRTSYQLVVRDRKAAVIDAENVIALESGNQVIAQQEYELFKEELVTTEQGKSLVLREPQLRQAQARHDAALGKLDEALLDIQRTTIRAPFNALILQSFIEKGKYIARLAPIARLVATDRFWVTLSVPVSALSFIDIPSSGHENGSLVTFSLNGHNGGVPFEKTGHVLRLQGEISTENRMAQIIVGIDDPLDLQNSYTEHFSKILLGSYLRAGIDCGQIDDVYKIPRSVLHDKNSIWVLSNGKLEIKEVSIVWSTKKDLFIEGNFEGARIITSRIQNPLRGMALSDNALLQTRKNQKLQ